MLQPKDRGLFQVILRRREVVRLLRKPSRRRQKEAGSPPKKGAGGALAVGDRTGKGGPFCAEGGGACRRASS